MAKAKCAIIILILTIIMCVLSFFYLENVTKTLTTEINLVKEYISKEETDLAFKKAESAIKVWNNNRKILKTFIDHSHLDNLETDLYELKSNLTNGETSEILATSENIISRIKQLKNSEKPSLENVL